MNFLIVSNYYYPEIGAAPNRITNLAEGLAERCNNVEVICPLPNYPTGKIFEGYKGIFQKQEMNNLVKINRYWVYPSVSRSPLLRILSMISFALSLWAYSFEGDKIRNTDWIIIQNSPLMVSLSSIILFKKLYKKKVALNVSDLWPLSALELGSVRKGTFYRILEWIEYLNYKYSDKIIGQSEEILKHVKNIIQKETILYRNIQRIRTSQERYNPKEFDRIKIVYAGLLGVAQGVYKIVEQINFAELGVEFDIYGHGNEYSRIVDFLEKHPSRGVNYKGSLSKKELDLILPRYHASIVPLVKSIKGALPSKIFESMQSEIPVLFCGGGEGAKIVEEYGVGLTSPPGDYVALKRAILQLRRMPASQYDALKENCRKASMEEFTFEKQLTNLIRALSNA